MTREQIENNIKNGIYSLNYEVYLGLRWSINKIVDSSKDETWNRNAIEEHNDEIDALNTIYFNELDEKKDLFKQDILECLFEEMFLELKTDINIASKIMIRVIKIYDKAIKKIGPYSSNKWDFTSYIQELYEEILMIYNIENMKEFAL